MLRGRSTASDTGSPGLTRSLSPSLCGPGPACPVLGAPGFPSARVVHNLSLACNVQGERDLGAHGTERDTHMAAKRMAGAGAHPARGPTVTAPQGEFQNPESEWPTAGWAGKVAMDSNSSLAGGQREGIGCSPTRHPPRPRSTAFRVLALATARAWVLVRHPLREAEAPLAQGPHRRFGRTRLWA